MAKFNKNVVPCRVCLWFLAPCFRVSRDANIMRTRRRIHTRQFAMCDDLSPGHIIGTLKSYLCQGRCAIHCSDMLVCAEEWNEKNFVFWQSVWEREGEGERKKIRQCKLMRSFFSKKVQKKKLMICCKLDFLIGGTERAPKLAVFNSMKSPLATRKLGEIKHTVSLARARERRARKTRLNG